MTSWLTHYFVPHDGNDHQPHMLRTETSQLLLFILLASQALFLVYSFIVMPRSAHVAAVLVPVLINQTNAERAGAHLSSLAPNVLLTRSAQIKADDMAARGYFAHNDPNGVPPWNTFKDSGYEYRFAGENLAVNFVESKDITDAWMNSPTHRENLLNGKYTEVGIATALGKYKGKDAIFVVQHFGTPLVPTPIAKIPARNQAGVEKISAPTLAGAGALPKVLGAESSNETRQNVSFLERVKTEPRTLSLVLQLAIALIASTALLLAFFVRMRVQHPIVLANGLLVVSMTIGMALLNVIVTRGSI